MFMIVLIMVLASISCSNGDTCSCTCCGASSCKPTLQGTITVASCAPSSCKSVCEAKYPSQCLNRSDSTNYQCTKSNNPTPNWIGEFDIANTCQTQLCCCPSGKAVLSHANVNDLRVQFQLVGQCPTGTTSLDQTFPMPDASRVDIVFLGNLILITLSDDSRTIQFTNQQSPQCSMSATRSGAVSNASINLALVSLLVGLVNLKHFII